MLNVLNNQKEINQRLFKYMIMYFANKHHYFPYIEQHIPKYIQNDLMNLKIHLLTSEKIALYKKQILPVLISNELRVKLEIEISQLIEARIKNKKKQYIALLYMVKRKVNKSIKNFCFLSGRSRAVYRAFHLSRIKIREYAQYGQFIGFKKISW